MKYIQFFATADLTIFLLCITWAFKAVARRKPFGVVVALSTAVTAVLLGRWALNRPEIQLSKQVELEWMFLWWPITVTITYVMIRKIATFIKERTQTARF